MPLETPFSRNSTISCKCLPTGQLKLWFCPRLVVPRQVSKGCACPSINRSRFMTCRSRSGKKYINGDASSGELAVWPYPTWLNVLRAALLPVAGVLIPSPVSFLDPAAARDKPDNRFNQAQHSVCVCHHHVTVDKHLVSTPYRKTGGSTDNRCWTITQC